MLSYWRKRGCCFPQLSHLGYQNVHLMARWDSRVCNTIFRIPYHRTLCTHDGSVKNSKGIFTNGHGNCFLSIHNIHPPFPQHLVCPEIGLLPLPTMHLVVILPQCFWRAGPPGWAVKLNHASHDRFAQPMVLPHPTWHTQARGGFPAEGPRWTEAPPYCICTLSPQQRQADTSDLCMAFATVAPKWQTSILITFFGEPKLNTKLRNLASVWCVLIGVQVFLLDIRAHFPLKPVWLSG